MGDPPSVKWGRVGNRESRAGSLGWEWGKREGLAGAREEVGVGGRAQKCPPFPESSGFGAQPTEVKFTKSHDTHMLRALAGANGPPAPPAPPRKSPEMSGVEKKPRGPSAFPTGEQWP